MRLWIDRGSALSKRRLAGVAVIVIYFAATSALLLSYLPGWYHPGAQRITILRAVEIFNEGPFPAIFGHPFSGANVYALLGSIPLSMGFDLRFVRLPMMVLGIVSAMVVLGIARWYEPEGQPPYVTVALLLVTPHFVVFSGFALPMIVTLTAGLFGIYGYLRYLEAGRRKWLVLSAFGGGLAAFNHFWGGVVFVTILGFDSIVLGRFARLRKRERLCETVRHRFRLWAAHVVALAPAVALYFFYRSSGSSGRYGKYTITDSAGLLLRPTWYKTLGFYTLQYHPTHFLVTALMAGLCWQLVRTRNLAVLTCERHGKHVVAPPAFWGFGWFWVPSYSFCSRAEATSTSITFGGRSRRRSVSPRGGPTRRRSTFRTRYREQSGHRGPRFDVASSQGC
ncbi:glycosyltransferase family 39 protein [Haloarculaceae archaeon H-GB11]|nr:glycosyltransferase family 39 protein [Haloarculaceae archaeon H-GB11]